VSPDDTAAPHVYICQEFPKNLNRNLCALSSIDLADGPLELPKESLEVQILIWNRADVVDPDTGELDCGRHPVRFGAVDGFPISQAPSPAIGGHAYYQPGDEEVVVNLGCTSLPSVNTCELEGGIDVSASVFNFENLGVVVSVNEATRFDVEIGEPREATVGFTLDQRERLELTVEGVVPIWRKNVATNFVDVACLHVLEETSQATASVTCVTKNIPVMPGDPIDIGGYQLPKATLDQVLSALNMPFPMDGLTVGIVIDELFNPLPGVAVTTVNSMGNPGTIRYLAANRLSFGGTVTSASGIFVSTDAEFNTTFNVDGAESQIGGRIRDKVTIVVIQK
jgi:hypothetical protein